MFLILNDKVCVCVCARVRAYVCACVRVAASSYLKWFLCIIALEPWTSTEITKWKCMWKLSGTVGSDASWSLTSGFLVQSPRDVTLRPCDSRTPKYAFTASEWASCILPPALAFSIAKAEEGKLASTRSRSAEWPCSLLSCTQSRCQRRAESQ